MKKIISIIMSIVMLFTVSSSTFTSLCATKAPTVTSSKRLKSYTLTSNEKSVQKKTNEQRKKYGLKELKYSSVLHSIACIRAKEASKKWSHTRPNGKKVKSLFDEYGIKYKSGGENLYCGDSSPSNAINLWMKSPSHKSNIVNKKYTYFAVGSYTKKEGNKRITYYCQIFYQG